MSPRWMRMLGFSAGVLAGLAACTPPATEEPPGPSPGAGRLVIPEADLGPQAHKLLASLKSDPYVYFRFINRPWSRAACAALGPEPGPLSDVHLHGDAHVGQYAYTLTDHGLDDLDDTITGPAALDVVRFLGSVDLAARARGWTEEREALFDEFFRGYRAALLDRGYEPPLPSYVSRMREALAEEVDHAAFLEWAESLMEPVEEVDDSGIEEGRRRLAGLIATQRPELPSFYLEPKRIGWLRMGVGSALTPKLLLRCEGRTREEEDDFLLEGRELSDLRQVKCVDTSDAHRAARILEGYGRLGRIRHEIVVVVPAAPDRAPGSREWWARSWEPSYRELQLDQLQSPRELAEVIHDAGAQLGNGHVWDPESETGDALSERRLDELQRLEPRMRALALQLSNDLLEAWEIFRAPPAAS